MPAPILPVSSIPLPQAIRPAGQAAGGGFQDVLAGAIQRVESIGQNASSTVERFLAGEGEEFLIAGWIVLPDCGKVLIFVAKKEHLTEVGVGMSFNLRDTMQNGALKVQLHHHS